MDSAKEAPQAGTIIIEWVVGDDPGELTTYGWNVRCDPPLPDEFVSAILAEVAAVY